jgi:hypothetical protein
MQIQFNEVLTPTQFLAQLSFVIGELEELGVKRMPNPRIDFWLGGPNDPYAAALKDAGVDADALTIVKVQPGTKAGRKPKFHLVPGKRPVASQLPQNGIKYKDLIGQHRDAIDIRGDTKALGNTDDPDVIVPRLLRMTMALLMDLAAVAAGGDDDAIDQVDRPQEVLGGRSYWMPRSMMMGSCASSRWAFSTRPWISSPASDTPPFTISRTSGSNLSRAYLRI